MDKFKSRMKFGICDVDREYRFYFKWLLNKLNQIFKWNNLPETVDETFLNNMLFLNGNVCWTDKLKGQLTVYYGNPGGEPDRYYMPTLFTIANPVMGSASVRIENDAEGIMMFNSKGDKFFTYMPSTGGLFELIHQTATLLADNVVSINTAQINTRVQGIVTAGSDVLRRSAEVYMKQLYAGKPYTVIDENLAASIKVNPISSSASSNYISQLIELHQYIIAQFFNSVGIKTNPVNKKERLITDEINSVDNYLAVSLNEMLISRQESIERINKKYNTNISVELADELKPVVEEATQPATSADEDGNEANADGREATDDGAKEDDNNE